MNLKTSNDGLDNHKHGHALDDKQPAQPEEGHFIKTEPHLKKVRLWITLAVPLVSSAAAGSREPWALSIVAALVGLNIALTAPRARISRAISWPLCLVMLLSMAGLLPLAASSLPEWRIRLAQDFSIFIRSKKPAGQ